MPNPGECSVLKYESLAKPDTTKPRELPDIPGRYHEIHKERREVKRAMRAFARKKARQMSIVNGIRDAMRSVTESEVRITRKLSEISVSVDDKRRHTHAYERERMQARCRVAGIGTEVGRSKIRLARCDSSAMVHHRSMSDLQGSISRDLDDYDRSIQFHKAVISERDEVVASLIRRNDELAFLTEAQRSLEDEILLADSKIDRLESEMDTHQKRFDRLRSHRHKVDSTNSSRSEVESEIYSLQSKMNAIKVRGKREPLQRELVSQHIRDPVDIQVRLRSRLSAAISHLTDYDVRLEELLQSSR